MGIKGFPIKEAQNLITELRNLDSECFENWRVRKKWEIFQYHYLKTHLYQARIKSLSEHNELQWSNIPVMKKKDFQNYENLKATENKVFVSNTSGSSGHPFYFAKDKFCHALTWAMILDRYHWHGLKYGESLQARFYGIPLGWKENARERIKDRISARIRFPIFNLSDSVMKQYLEQFAKYRFDYINGYTSVLTQFARYLLRERIVLKEICPSLKVIIPTAETLSENDREILLQAYGLPVVNEYGASEVGIIAFENNKAEWIVSNENLFIEIVDDNDQPVEPNRPGRILVTDLFNKAMPFIRYEIGDIGALSPNKSKGYDILTKLLGRTNDFAILPSGKKAPGLTFYYISKNLLERGFLLKEFIIKQIEPNHFHFEYVSDKELDPYQKKHVSDAMRIYLEPGLKSTFEKKDRIERSLSGKLKHFQYLVETGEDNK
jgi:phenylacetate-CoA ligase